MLRWMMIIKRIEEIANEEIRTRTGVTNISEKIRLIWLGHVERKTEEYVVMRTWKMEVCGPRNIGRPKLRWSDVIRKDMNEKQVKREEARGRRPWRLKTRCDDPNTEKAEQL